MEKTSTRNQPIRKSKISAKLMHEYFSLSLSDLKLALPGPHVLQNIAAYALLKTAKKS